ncbi:MAG: tetratricopeptide repeat protein [Chloroflexi bacterium]|nr:tetratricopeptide repeat protein [Chloroflexota bacterium]
MGFFRRQISEAEKHYMEALRCRRRDKAFNLGLAVWHLKQAIELEPGNPLLHFELGRAYAAVPLLAVTRRLDGSFRISESLEMAIAEAKEALRLKPNYPEAYLILGEAYMYLGEREKASEAFGAVFQLSRDQRLRYHAQRESRQMKQGLGKKPQPEEARKCLEQAVAYRDRGEYRRAERKLGKALKLAPDWPWMYDTLCKLGG